MAFLFPRVAFSPAVCGPVRHDIAPLFSLFDDTLNEIQRASRQTRRQFNPRFDVKETKDSYSLEGEVPGIDQNNLSIEFTDEHTLTIKGRHESHVEQGQRSTAAQAEQSAVEDSKTSTPSETGSVKSHQATVEDEEPANESAVESSQSTPAPTTQEVAESEKSQQPENKHQYWVSERSVGEFSRSFNFPSRVNQEEVKASLKNGILSIIVPKAPAPASRRINIE